MLNFCANFQRKNLYLGETSYNCCNFEQTISFYALNHSKYMKIAFYQRFTEETDDDRKI